MSASRTQETVRLDSTLSLKLSGPIIIISAHFLVSEYLQSQISDILKLKVLFSLLICTNSS